MKTYIAVIQMLVLAGRTKLISLSSKILNLGTMD